MYVKHLAQCLAQMKHPINVSNDEMFKDDTDSCKPTLNKVVSAHTMECSFWTLTVAVSW